MDQMWHFREWIFIYEKWWTRCDIFMNEVSSTKSHYSACFLWMDLCVWKCPIWSIALTLYGMLFTRGPNSNDNLQNDRKHVYLIILIPWSLWHQLHFVRQSLEPGHHFLPFFSESISISLKIIVKHVIFLRLNFCRDCGRPTNKFKLPPWKPFTDFYVGGILKRYVRLKFHIMNVMLLRGSSSLWPKLKKDEVAFQRNLTSLQHRPQNAFSLIH